MVPMEQNENDLFLIRKEKFDALCQQGKNPFRANCKQTHFVKQVLELFEKAEKETALFSILPNLLPLYSPKRRLSSFEISSEWLR